MPQIKINGTPCFAEIGERLSEILIREGKTVSHICGGKGSCKKCGVLVDGEEKLSCQYIIEKDVEVIFPEKQVNELRESVGRSYSEDWLALDIGTTTLALALVCGGDSGHVRINSAPNPQCVFGADVISRIEYAAKNGVEDLQKAVVKGINELIRETHREKISEMYVSGNTTMLHILAGENPASMGAAPYEPVFLDKMEIDGGKVGIHHVEKLILLPSISAFVGADIVAGINIAGFPSDGKYKMLVDLGTNAEIVLYSQLDGICTSAAAGPCFEGANISCGMSATDGAIYSFKTPYSREEVPEIKVIGNCRPEGICGTGLIDIIAELLRKGIIDETGFMECGEYEITCGVSLNQRDVREFQLAKSAIYSGIISLIKNAGISFDDIEVLYVSGGFASKINIDNAVETGLLPEELKDKCVVLNNSCLSGTVLYSLEKRFRTFFADGNMRYVDLSCDENFSRLFIDNMEF